MKYIFSLLVMLVVYNGFAQNNTNEKRNNMITFPNGDESITIIPHSDKNEIKLTTTDNFHKYRMLELSNHEAVHPASSGSRNIKNVSRQNYSANYNKSNQQGKNKNGTLPKDTSGV